MKTSSILFKQETIDNFLYNLEEYMENYVNEEDKKNKEFDYKKPLTEAELQIIDDYNDNKLPQVVKKYFEGKMRELNITNIERDTFQPHMVHVELYKCRWHWLYFTNSDGEIEKYKEISKV